MRRSKYMRRSKTSVGLGWMSFMLLSLALPKSGLAEVFQKDLYHLYSERTFNTDVRQVESVTITPDNRKIIITTQIKTGDTYQTLVSIQDVLTHETHEVVLAGGLDYRRLLSGGKKMVFSSYAPRVAVYGGYGRFDLHLLDLDTLQVQSLQAPGPASFEVDPTESALFLTDYQGAQRKIRRLEVASGKTSELDVSLAANAEPRILDSNHFLFCSNSCQTLLNDWGHWQIRPEEFLSVVDLSNGEIRTFNQGEALLSADSKHLILTKRTDQRALVYWDLQRGAMEERSVSSDIEGIIFSSDSRLSAFWTNAGIVVLHDWATGREIALRSADWQLSGAAFNPNSQEIAISSYQHLSVYDLLSFLNQGSAPAETELDSPSGPHGNPSYSPDGKYLLVISGEDKDGISARQGSLLDRKANWIRKDFSLPGADPEYVDWSPQSNSFYTYSNDRLRGYQMIYVSDVTAPSVSYSGNIYGNWWAAEQKHRYSPEGDCLSENLHSAAVFWNLSSGGGYKTFGFPSPSHEGSTLDDTIFLADHSTAVLVEDRANCRLNMKYIGCHAEIVDFRDGETIATSEEGVEISPDLMSIIYTKRSGYYSDTLTRVLLDLRTRKSQEYFLEGWRDDRLAWSDDSGLWTLAEPKEVAVYSSKPIDAQRLAALLDIYESDAVEGPELPEGKARRDLMIQLTLKSLKDRQLLDKKQAEKLVRDHVKNKERRKVAQAWVKAVFGKDRQ